MARVVKVIGVTGMPGSGKSEAMQVAKQRGMPVIRMGDLIWEEVERRGLPRDAIHVGQVADAMRKEKGDDVWALQTVERIKRIAAQGPKLVLIDGVRSNHEVDVFRRELGNAFLLLAIHTDARKRWGRLSARGRSDDPQGHAAEAGHRSRDEREMEWGIARTIALADEMVVNDGTLEDFARAFGALLDRLQA